MNNTPDQHRESAKRLIDAAKHHIEAAYHYEKGNEVESAISAAMAQGGVSLAMDVQLNNADNFLKVVVL